MEFRTRLIEKIERTSDVASFRFVRPDGADFIPGQYFLLSLDINGKEQMKPFSFSSSPNDKEYLEFTKKFTGSDFSRALKDLSSGDEVKIRMPMGKFTFTGEHDKIALLSGGIGITPFKSICGYAAEEKLSSDIVLLYGNSSEEDIVFREELDRLAQDNPAFKVVYTLTSREACPADGVCRKGYIDECMIREEVGDLEKRVFYVCGPPAMVECLVGILRDRLGVPPDRIVLERFAGYK